MSTLAQFSVGYVARSFSSDPAASKALLEKVFDPERLEKYAHTEVPALCHEISGIAACDPGFAVWIYGRVFGYHVDSERETRMTPSHIMPMTSNESQDYNLARYGLAQFFPALLAENPAAATEAVIGAVEGEIVVREHLTRTPIDQPFTVDGKQLMLREDGSAVWAWDRNNAHPDGFGMILGRFVAYLREANSTDLAPVVNTLFEKNSVALLWARLLMVGAERPDILADKLWGLATNERIMLSSSVGHDAIEAVAAFYPSRSLEERRTFELATFDFGADDQIHPSIREEWLATLFQAIGLEQLATEEAREFLSSEKGSKPSPNARFEILSSRMEMTQRQILSEAGVLVDEPANDGLLTLIEAVKTQVGLVHAGTACLRIFRERLNSWFRCTPRSKKPRRRTQTTMRCARLKIWPGTFARRSLEPQRGKSLRSLRKICSRSSGSPSRSRSHRASAMVGRRGPVSFLHSTLSANTRKPTSSLCSD